MHDRAVSSVRGPWRSLTSDSLLAGSVRRLGAHGVCMADARCKVACGVWMWGQHDWSDSGGTRWDSTQSSARLHPGGGSRKPRVCECGNCTCSEERRL